MLNDYHGTRPYSLYKIHKQKYYKGYSRPQQTIAYRDNNHENNGNHKNSENNGHDNKGGGDKSHGKKGGGKDKH